MIITPYSALDTDAELPATSANFPALKHFFPCNEAAGSLQITDIVGGVIVPTNALTKPDSVSIFASGGNITDSDVTLTDGAWSAPGTKKTLLFAVGDLGLASKVWMGKASTGAFLGLSGQITTCSISDGTTTKQATALTGGAVYGIGVLIDWTNITSFEAIGDGSAAYSAKAPVALSPLAALNSIPAFANFNNINASLYGFAVFEFAGALPSDVASAVTWMTQNWIAGKKGIYPGWKGLL